MCKTWGHKQDEAIKMEKDCFISQEISNWKGIEIVTLKISNNNSNNSYCEPGISLDYVHIYESSQSYGSHYTVVETQSPKD